MLKFKSLAAACCASFLVLGCSQMPSDHRNATPTLGAKSSNTIATLTSHHWHMQQARTAQGQIDEQWHIASAGTDGSARSIELNFSENQTVSVENLCNRVFGQYQAQGQNLQIGHLVSTMMACNNTALMQLEQRVAQHLPKAKSWSITNEPTTSLVLHFGDGATWHFSGKPTHETLYGRSERIFLEVAPRKIDCDHAVMGKTQCLQVRSVEYDNNGLKTSTGNWSMFYDAIEGYTHREGIRNVLRLKRYTRTNAPADASKYVYVLDITVESESLR